MDGPRPPSATVFYISIATSGETTSRCSFQRGKLCEKKLQFVKIIIVMQIINVHRRCSTGF